MSASMPVESNGQSTSAPPGGAVAEPMAEYLDNPFAPPARPAPPATPATLEREAASVRYPAARALLAGLRPLTGYEEEFIEQHRNQGNTAALCNEVLARCLVPPGATPDEQRAQVGGLLVAERDRALVTLRRISLGDRVDTEVDCPTCGKASDISFDLSSLPLDFEPPPMALEVTLADGRVARLRMPTAADQAALLDQRLETMAERRTWLLARLITALGDQAGPVAAGAVHALPSGDRGRMEAALERAVPRIDLTMDVTCGECAATFEAPFDMADFFLPS